MSALGQKRSFVPNQHKVGIAPIAVIQTKATNETEGGGIFGSVLIWIVS